MLSGVLMPAQGLDLLQLLEEGVVAALGEGGHEPRGARSSVDQRSMVIFTCEVEVRRLELPMSTAKAVKVSRPVGRVGSHGDGEGRDRPGSRQGCAVSFMVFLLP